MVQYSAPSSGSTDLSFGALADATRRGILGRLSEGDATITELAERFEMSLTGVKKHVQVLEDAGLASTRKVGRVRLCSLGPQRLEQEAAWIAAYRRVVEERHERLAMFLERTKGDPG